MIKNDRQYTYTKNKLHEFQKDLKEIQQKYSFDKSKLKLLSQGYIEHIAQLKTEIANYEKIKTLPLPKKLRANTPAEISQQLVRLRVAKGLTQAQLAARMGCRQSDISRMERADYKGYSYQLLEKVANILGVDLELIFIALSEKSKESDYTADIAQKYYFWAFNKNIQAISDATRGETTMFLKSKSEGGVTYA